MTLGQACIEYRAKHKLSQTDMAVLCEVNINTIRRVEQDEQVRPTTEAKIRFVINE